MTSYMYNPSQKVTEILSKFLEFDPEQLELGIWSGDFSLNNVKLRQEAVQPLLNKKANKPHTNPLKKAPLHMKLVSGTVGHMRIRIPWKRLVWGQGAVQLDISDIDIVLAFQSREETERQKKAEKRKKKKKKDKNETTEESVYTKSFREAKQRRLREAERRHLQGMPVALYLDNIHRKNSIQKEATKATLEAKKMKKKNPKQSGRVDRWLKNATSDFFWRFYAGLQGSIKKARIVVVQDGVEVGVIIQSIEVVAGKDGTRVTVTTEDSETGDDHMASDGFSPPGQFVYESEYDDGEHVDKTFKQQGLGIFVRKEVSMAKVPKTLQFSSSVSADDYILRPVDLDLSFSFFYPYPPDRRKQSTDSPSHETPSTAASTSGASIAESATTSTSKRRRGKRERASPSLASTTATNALTSDRRATLRRNNSSPNLSPIKDMVAQAGGDANQRYVRSHRRMADQISVDTRRGSSGNVSRPVLNRKKSGRSLKSASVSRNNSSGMSIDQLTMDEHTIVPGRQIILSPKFDCRFTLQEIRVVFSTRHYELMNYFVSTVLRMQNGKPDQHIRLVRETDPSAFHLKMLEDHPLSPRSDKKKISSGGATSKIGALLKAPLNVFRSTMEETKDESSINFHEGMKAHIPAGGIQSARSEVTVNWWRYAIGAILWEVRKRKHLNTNFRQMYISFDWKKQRHRRQEYINLYVAVKLDKRQNDTVWPFEDLASKEQTLEKIEDELSIEQILLYRSIARSMRVRGIKKMPESLVELHITHATTALAVKNSLKNRRGSLATGISSDKRTERSSGSRNAQLPAAGEATMLSLIQNKFEDANRVRAEGSTTWMRNVAAKQRRRGHDSSSDEDSDNISTQNAQNQLNSSGRGNRNASMGYDSVGHSDSGGRRRRSTEGRTPRKSSIGYDSGSEVDLRAGNLYQAGGKMRDSQADGRTIRTNQKGRESKHTRQTAATRATTVDTDNRMRFAIIVQVKSIDIMIIQEDYLFDIAPLETDSRRSIGVLSHQELQGEYDSSESSSSEVSELSVLTDDRRFFENGPVGPIAEEEQEEQGARMSSTDFLLFGLPENALLRITISSLGSSMKGKSGGAVDVKLVVGRIAAVGEDDSHILSMGPADRPLTPVTEVNVGVQRAKSSDSLSVDLNLSRDDDKGTDFVSSRRPRGIAVRQISSARLNGSSRAISMRFSNEDGVKNVQCDLSKIAVSVDLNPAAKLLQFYSKSDIKYPHKILEKSSREVARKFMVYKTATSSGLGNMSTAIRVHGLEIMVPYTYHKGDGITSEASELVSSKGSSNPLLMKERITKHNCSVLVSAGTLELYGGRAVDEIAASSAVDLGQSRSSLWSGSYTSKKTVKTMEMLDLAELTANHDSFAANNWVAILGGINCVLDSQTTETIPQLTDVPIDIEVLLTVNRLSLLETENPKHEAVIEVSPVHVVLSENRLNLLRAAKASVDFDVLDTTTRIRKLKRRKPDPPRIEILSRRILHSIDLSCKKVDVALVKDGGEEHSLSLKHKELVMEESLSDFLSVVSCFDFSLPNEEALSSAMQVCIGRLVGLGLTDDEAWGCTNAARLNFLDDIALMRRAQTDVLVQLSASIRGSQLLKTPLREEAEEDETSSSAPSFDDASGSKYTAQEEDEQHTGPESVATSITDEITDDDSANSADIVETTFKNAVEKTVATFSPLLQEYHGRESNKRIILSFNLPYGLRLSLVKLFYDQYLTFLMTSVVVTNSAGIELVTLVPYSNDSSSISLEDDEEADNGQGISFSRFDLDKGYGFGSGGLGMSVLANDEGADTDRNFRDRARFDDIGVGEIELLFSSKLYEEIIEDLSNFGSDSSAADESIGSDAHDNVEPSRPPVDSSSAIVAATVSALFTTDQLVPFSRLTMERISYRNKKALEAIPMSEVPSWSLHAASMLLENLSPEGQFYPTTLAALESEESVACPFQLRYFKSSDPWQFSSRLQIEFTGFRLYLIRQFLNEVLQFFVYGRDGFSRLKKKYSKDIRDIHGNQRPPLLYSVRVLESSIICPRNSTCSDMAAFEVEEAFIAVSYIPGTFTMPTESSCFQAFPRSSNPNATRFRQDRNMRSSSVSEFQDCVEEEEIGEEDKSSTPISSYTKDMRKRLTIELKRTRVFTTIAENKEARDVVESPLFRFFHRLNGRADHGKPVYIRKENAERQPSVDPESLLQIGRYKQYWEEISTNLLDVTVFADYAPHMRLLISTNDAPLPFSLDARMSQLILLLTVWDSNMQELPTMFPFPRTQISDSATPPKIPVDFPKFGTAEYVSFLEDRSSIRSEICCMFKTVQLRCTYDPPGFFPVDPGCFPYFEDPRCPDDEKPGTVLTLTDAVVHVVNDFLNVRRIAIGASSIHILDERREPWAQDVLVNSPFEGNGNTTSPPAWADLSWGLHEDVRTLNSSLPLPVQFSVFMTPGWSLINVGAQDVNGTMFELSWVWCFLDYFKSYYTISEFGNPGHVAQRWTHQVKNSLRKANGEQPVSFVPLPGVKVDFRLWLCRPTLCVPSDYLSSDAPCLIIDSKTGLFYHFKNIETLSAQEVVSTDLNLHFSNEYQPPDIWRHRDMSLESVSGVRSLVEGLSFGLRYDCNNLCNHKDVSVLIPYAGDKLPSLSVAGSELEVPPVTLPAPAVCRPSHSPGRSLGPRVCDITCIIEVLPITSSTMMNFFKGPAEINEEFAAEEEDQGPPGFSVAVQVGDLRLFAIDPVLGVQLPVAVVSLSSLSLTATKFAVEKTEANLGLGESPPEDLQVTVKCHLWVDYFKLGLTRSWEPLLEPFQFLMLFEQSRERGQGFTVDADTPFHINLPGALLQVLGDTIESFSNLIKESFGDKAQSIQALRRSVRQSSPSKNRVGVTVEDVVHTMDGRQVDLLHEIPKPLKSDDRVAFSLRNLTGQKIRVHQQTDKSSDLVSSKPAVVTYLNQTESMGLTFAATISVVKNLSIVEVPYPGLPNSQRNAEYQGSLNHAVDLQAPGFRWIKDIKVDTFGRKFESLVPRSPTVLSKILRDWRLENAMMLLTEVGLDSGGRLVTVRSLFEIRNDTTHPIKIVYNPDPRYRPRETVSSGDTLYTISEPDGLQDESLASSGSPTNSREVEVVQPGEVFQVPTLLLERSLQMEGSHLGCLWLCPETRDQTLSFWEFFRSSGTAAQNENTVNASFCSRPIQLAKLVHESSVIFQKKAGQDIPVDDARSGIQVSCPTRTRSGSGQAPFCYAIEVGRSPIVNVNTDKGFRDAKESSQLFDKKNVAEKKPGGAEKKSKKLEEKVHGPVAYSLSIHAPIVIVNLLPEGGRFELMHAIRRTVLWYADLQPGQQVPVHSVGLDAPLLLLVNLGFCRTPVGEGALVHHGVETAVRTKEQTVGFKSIGKAVKKGTKQIGKTMTAISDSPDKRGQGRVGQIAAHKYYDRENRKEKGKQKQVQVAVDGSLGLDGDTGIGAVGGKVHSVETQTYSASDVASETTVVDGVGQRLTLNIENVRGGGGQRRVSLFCPFWIVNTTEHALRYKQDKGKSFVSGTVVSMDQDGSRPVDGSNRNYRNRHKMQYSRRDSDERWRAARTPMNPKTIFAGTPGALATSPGTCCLTPPALAELIDKELPLEKLADLAFMFNFHEEGLSIGHQTLLTQLYDGTSQSGTSQSGYVSEWSRGFSLDSVGFSQIVAMHCKEGRCLELSVEVNVAPGFLSAYTKIVRFLPRYVIYNRLETPIRLWQDSSVFRSVNEDRATDSSSVAKESRKWRYISEDKHYREKINQYESLLGRPATIDDRCHSPGNAIAGGTTAHRSALYINSVGPSELVPFALPDSRAERQLRVDSGGAWNVTSSFASELPGEHVLRVTQATDLRLLNHVSTRAAPKYKLVLPPPDDAGLGKWDGELGVFFETDWGGDRRIIVKGTKRGKYAHNHTDIHVGDELLRVDGVSVIRMSFAETMKLIKERLAYVAAAQNTQQKTEESTKSGGVFRRISIGVVRRQQGAAHARQSGSGSTSAQLTLTFRTLEERLRKLRLKAGKNNGNPGARGPSNGRPDLDRTSSITSLEQNGGPSVGNISVELKSLHNTMFVILRDQDKENPPFRIQNRSINHIVFFRQRGCDGHPWNQLKPGESMPYSWEEPIKSKKLTVRVAASSQEFPKIDGMATSSQQESFSESEFSEMKEDAKEESAREEKNSARAARVRQALSYQFVDNEERGGFGPPITVRLEEIGFRNLLPVPDNEGRKPRKRRKFLNCEVDTDGGTRLLVISDDAGAEDERAMLNRHLDTLRKQIIFEQNRVATLHSLRCHVQAEEAKGSITATSPKTRGEGNKRDHVDVDKSHMIETDARHMMEDFPEETTITSRNQVVVEVLEAVGLNASDFVGSCNPYCEVFLKGRSKSRKYFFQKRVNKRKTYFIEKCLNPKWTEQAFVFDVPEDAVRVTKGHSLQVKVRNFRLVGQHPILGLASVHLGNLRNQQELVGWYPLAGRTGRRETDASPFSDFTRGSIKLRVRWIFSSCALIDYFLFLSQERLNQLQQSRKGMTEQLSHAVDSDKRKREARDQLKSGRIKKLVKLEQRSQARASGRSRSAKPGGGKMGINTSLTVLKDTLKSSRDRYLYALYFQTVESKRNRQLEQDEKLRLTSGDDSGDARMNLSELPMISEQKSPGGSLAGSLASSKKSLETFLSQQRSNSMQSPRYADNSKQKPRTLDDFFAQQKEESQVEGPKPAVEDHAQGGKVETPRRLSRRLLDSDAGRRLISRRRLSLDIEDLEDDENGDNQVDQWQGSLRQGQALYDGLYGQTPDLGISDLISVSTDVDEEAKRMKNILALFKLGYVFHEDGEYFHEDHLPHHFRRSLFASSIDRRRSARLYRSKFAVGTSSAIRHFKSAQAAGALHFDPELEVILADEVFHVRFRDKRASPNAQESEISNSKAAIKQRLTVPREAPPYTIARSKERIESMALARTMFERMCRRTLGAVLNPGGWLTIRPITVLNLPDTYNGMFVKLRYGSEVLVSETVDAKVTPRWASPEILPAGKDRMSFRRSSSRSENHEKFKFSENDLHVHVEPQQTSGSIKISVVAERLKNKTELGVLQIPLGAAIAACIDAAEDDDLQSVGILPKPMMYIRWFPLMNPRLAVPVEGDMGLSSRPRESEQLRDNTFQQYFAPCIQLALIWWPDSSDAAESDSESGDSEELSVALALRGPDPATSQAAAETPVVQTYFNADVSRISAALIDSQRALELLSFSALDIDVRYSVTKSKTRIGLVVGWIQLDHQDKRAREPVVFAPTPMEHVQPTLQILALKDNLRTKSNIMSYEYIGVALQEMDLTVEESWIFELWDFFMGIMKRRRVKQNTAQGEKRADLLSNNENCFTATDMDDTGAPALLAVLRGEGEGASASTRRKIYVEQLILGLVKINLSYVKGKNKGQPWELTDGGAKKIKNMEVKEIPNLALAAGGVQLGNFARTDQSEVFAKWSQHTYDEDLLSTNAGYNLPGIIAAVFPSVSDAPIRLQGKAIDHVFESPGEILSSIKNFYVNETMKQVYKIIGSLDFVGNPTIIFSSFVSGVRDLVVAPTTAFLKSPTNVNQVGIGVAKGTISLFSHSASGIFGFAAKMSASAGQAAAILSLDPEYRQWHRDRIVTEATNLNRVWKRRGVQSISDMITRPVGDILMGVAMGASGFFISPYKGAVRGGKWGFVQGVAAGTAGVVAKPLVGFLDAFTHFSATAHDIAKSVNVLERRYQPALKLRLPYSFGPMNILVPFDPVTARSVFLLQIFPAKTKRSKRRGDRSREIHVHSEVLHMEPGVETYAIATTVRVVLIKLKKDNGGVLSPSFAWEVDLSGDGIVISQVADHGHNGVALTITKREEDKKGRTGIRDGNNWKLRRDSTNNRTPISQLSNISSRSDNSQSDTDDADRFDHLDATGTIQPAVANEDEGDDVYHTHGSKKAGGKVLEWFTVLAEYQHRRQLTRLHNAISSIVGNYDAVIVDEGRGFHHSQWEGITTFGIFNFERDMPTATTVAASNAALVQALDNLPWMHETLFKTVQELPGHRRRDFISELRNDWTFMRDLDASVAQGGPNWLVETRARAMFVAEVQLVPEKHSHSTGFSFDNTPEQSLTLGSRLVTLEGSDFHDSSPVELTNSVDLNSGPVTIAESDCNSDPVLRLHIPQRDDNADTREDKPYNDSSSHFRQSLEFEDALSYEMDDPKLSPDTGRTKTMYPVGSEHRNVATGGDQMSHATDLLSSEPEVETKPASGVDTKVTEAGVVAVPSNDSSPPASSRIDRMENLMEQLVILNATQAQRQHAVPTEIFSETYSAAGDIGIAGVIKNELAELRNQVQARAKEDDALRDEISALRKQLADRRNAPVANNPARIGTRLADVFRLNRNDQSDKDDKETLPKETTLESTATPNKPLLEATTTPNKEGDVAKEEPTTEPRPGRRFSGDSTNHRRPTRRLSVGSAVSKATSTPRRDAGEVVRRFSGDSVELGKMLRRSSGSHRRSSGSHRRASGSHLG